MSNPYGWHLPVTDAMVQDESPYRPLDDPAENAAERLVMLAHLSFDSSVWSTRLDRYWAAFGEHVEASTNQPSVSAWWGALMRDLPGTMLRSPLLLHEKNLLCRPAVLPGTAVADEAVLMVLRVNTLELRDRTRLWAKVRRETRVVDTAAADDLAVPEPVLASVGSGAPADDLEDGQR